MGPMNVAIVNLFRADQALRDAKGRLDAATKNVRLQQRRTDDLGERLQVTSAKLRELQVRSANLDLDMRARDEQIERLRTTQQAAKNNKEYQSLLVEINTRKVDRSKVEEEAIKVLEQVETVTAETTALAASLDAERVKVAEVKGQMAETVGKLQAEIDSLTGPREAAVTSLSAKALTAFNRLADHHEGEALAALIKPDRRKEEYACSGCMMGLVTDVYNKLHTRDDMVFCPSCRRILYIPDDLPVEAAVNNKKPSMRSVGSARTKIVKTGPAAVGEPSVASPPPRPQTPLEMLLTAAQGESVKGALDADQRPLELSVLIDGRDMGRFKGKSADNLLRIIRFRLEEADLRHEVEVSTVAPPQTADDLVERTIPAQ